MNAPVHHLEEDVLLDYVTGAASEPVALIAACHLTLCETCQGRAAAAEMVGGALIESAGPVPLAAGALGRLLARLEQREEERRSDPRLSEGPAAGRPFMFGDVPLPRALARYLGEGDASADPGGPRYRFLAPGIRGIDLPMSAASPVRTRLLQLAPRVTIPRHSHGGAEYTMVFSGGLSDGGDHYGRGDVRFRDIATVHEQRVEGDDPCVALVVNQGALIPQTWSGRVASLLFDR